MDSNYPIITQKIKLISIQKLDFATKDGDKIQGVKIYYLTSPDDNMRDNYIGGVVQNSFISGVDSLKIFDSNKNIILPKSATLSLELYSTSRPPRAVGVKID